MVLEDAPYAPSLGWRAASTATIAFTGFLAKAFARIACSTEVYGLESFVKLLNDRENVEERDRGLITGMLELRQMVLVGSIVTMRQSQTTSACTYRRLMLNSY